MKTAGRVVEGRHAKEREDADRGGIHGWSELLHDLLQGEPTAGEQHVAYLLKCGATKVQDCQEQTAAAQKRCGFADLNKLAEMRPHNGAVKVHIVLHDCERGSPTRSLDQECAAFSELGWNMHAALLELLEGPPWKTNVHFMISLNRNEPMSEVPAICSI